MLYGLYWKKATPIACWCCFIFGAGLMILNMLFRESFPLLLQSPLNSGALAMLAGLIIVPVVSMLTPKLDNTLVENTFVCYEKTSTVPAKIALGEEEAK